MVSLRPAVDGAPQGWHCRAVRRGPPVIAENARMHRSADRVAGAILPLTLAAAAAALLLPSRAVAERSDLLLAALVLLTALGIAPRRLEALRRRPGAVVALSLGPLLVLVPLAWGLSRLFDGPVRDGVLALGLAPTEVAAVGLVTLAGADAVLALAAVAGSLVAAAIAGPLALGVLGGSADVDTGSLVAGFALVVLVPLVAGLAARATVPALGRAEPEYGAGCAVVIAALVYAALSGTEGSGELGQAVLAGGAFLVASGVVAALVLRVTGDMTPAFCLGLRDFAVAAALATEAFGPRAGTVAGVYGVMMLVAGAALAAWGRSARGAMAAPRVA
jgi:predicted Na+-dependent transporter